MEILSLGYLGFETTRHEQWLSFGPKVLGLGLGRRGEDGAVYLKMDDRRFRFAMHPGRIDQLSYIGWELRDIHAFEEAVKELGDKGIAHEAAGPPLLAERGVTEMAYFRDPAGFRHEIFYSQEFTPYSFVPGREISGFLADELGIGHVVLGVPEVTDDLRRFALDVLGFRIFTAYRGRMPEGQVTRMEFYRCNARSHVLGYLPYPGRRGVHHVGIDTLHMDDVGTCLDLCGALDVPIAQTLGRTMMEENVNFKLLTPTGFELEYGYGPLLIDDNKFLMRKPSRMMAWGHVYNLKNQATTLLPVDALEPTQLGDTREPASSSCEGGVLTAPTTNTGPPRC